MNIINHLIETEAITDNKIIVKKESHYNLCIFGEFLLIFLYGWYL